MNLFKVTYIKVFESSSGMHGYQIPSTEETYIATCGDSLASVRIAIQETFDCQTSLLKLVECVFLGKVIVAL